MPNLTIHTPIRLKKLWEVLSYLPDDVVVTSTDKTIDLEGDISGNRMKLVEKILKNVEKSYEEEGEGILPTT